ncbi:hypothetical protein TWF718_003338 [Orbilia javanica]|uniref:HNH nuclease domain-containing protein n=1 Tax=Orbilia javanica TaxID=47235 RepID=A0AAN8MNB7_9PEZI
MHTFTIQNQDYTLTARDCRPPTTVEKSRTAARIIGWSHKHNVRWRAPFEGIARQYMTLLNSTRRERGYINAAVRAFKESDIDGLTVRFIQAFGITGRGIHDLTASEVSPDKSWRIVSDVAATVVWPQSDDAVERRKRSDGYFRLINDALKASDLSITASFGAMIHVLSLSHELDLTSLNESGIGILDYQGCSGVELEKLGQSLNKIGITIDRAISHWLQRICASTIPSSRHSTPQPGIPARTFASVSVVSPRSTDLANQARIRDKHRCVVSHRTGKSVQVCHIIAYSIGKKISKRYKSEFWNFLAMFVGKEPMRKIHDYVIGQTDAGTLINRLENTILLSSELRVDFNEGIFVLEPLTQDASSPLPIDLLNFCASKIPTEYPVRYAQLPGQTRPLATRGAGLPSLSMDDVDPYELSQDPGIAGSRAYNHSLRRLLENGDIIWLRTDNPTSRPLPHPHLLWLHANISRVVRMSGRSGEYYYAMESDEEEEELELGV